MVVAVRWTNSSGDGHFIDERPYGASARPVKIAANAAKNICMNYSLMIFPHDSLAQNALSLALKLEKHGLPVVNAYICEIIILQPIP